jgi:hypothetical protein
MTPPDATPASPPDVPHGPPAVSRFEYDLLRVLRFLVGHMPADLVHSLVYKSVVPPPPCLSRTCVRLAQDTLSKAVVLWLARAGGWRAEKFLRRGAPLAGRHWERVPLAERTLTFSRHPLALAFWVTAEKPNDTATFWDAPRSEVTPADDLFFALALEAARPLHDVHPVLARRDAFRQNPFAWLMTPGDFCEIEPLEVPDFGVLFTGERAAFLECLQPVLAQRWVRSERAKGQVADWRRMRAQGRAEQATLSGFLAAAEAAGRQDLARFVLTAATTVLGGTADLTPAYWRGGLHGTGPQRLADRLETQRTALALPAQLARLQEWDRAARRVGYFDDGYAASQLWKEDWERAGGDEAAGRATRLLQQLDPLRT